MGFSLFHALGGAAKKYSENTKAVREQQMALFNDTIQRTQESFDKAIADRTSKSTELRRLGKELQAMGLDVDQSLVVLGSGVDTAKETIKRLQIAQGYATSKGDTFSAADYVTLANPEVTGLSLDEGIKNIMGIASSTPMPEMGQDSKYRSVRNLQEGAMSNIEKQYGMSMDEIRNIAFGNLEYGDTPAGTISGKLYELEGLEMREKVAGVRSAEAGATVAEAQASVADRAEDARVRILEADAKVKVIEAGAAKRMTDGKLKLLTQQIKEGKWNEDTREIRFAQATEEHNRKMAAMEQDYKGTNLAQAKAAVDLIWQGDLLAAELSYKIAQTAAENADALSGDPLKSSDARAIYNSQFENYIKTGALGKFEMVDGVPVLAELDDSGKAIQQQKIADWHDQMFASMVKQFGMNDTAMAIYGANSNKAVVSLAIDYSKPASEAVAKEFVLGKSILFDKKGERVAVVEDESGNFVYVPYSEYAIGG